ncbi:MAG TPA: RDD family protein [Pseudonocardiaceae bacterium]|nr:RDD family protein [Pseudonocardiaceae bacterium]
MPPPQFGRFSPSRQFSQYDGPARQGFSTPPGNPHALSVSPSASPAIIGAARIPGPLAGFGTRALSFVIDCVAPVIALTLLLLIDAVTAGTAWRLLIDAMAYLGLLGFGIWNCGYLQGATGCSLGRRMTGTKLVSIETGQPVGFGRALTRQVCHVLDLGIGYLRPLWNSKRQTFADKIVGTIVVHVGQPTNDFNIMNHRRLGE